MQHRYITRNDNNYCKLHAIIIIPQGLEPPVSDLVKCQTNVVAYGRQSLTRGQTTRGLKFESLLVMPCSHLES